MVTKCVYLYQYKTGTRIAKGSGNFIAWPLAIELPALGNWIAKGAGKIIVKYCCS